MPVDSIGTVLNPGNGMATQQNTIQQEDFIRLFLSQLQFQDPLEPVDNREFLAQLAQFSSLEQSRQTSENTESMLAMNSATQALDLLDRDVEVQNGGVASTGTVTAIRFTPTGPELTVQTTLGQVLPNVRLSQISLVKP
ncbi:MAG TPA: flagellar hook capping FlgD N-terminal domain-containing protein [Arenimonas sp.]|uniref:flagellar hook assembly protein FlgD n=1 Tax=Arenimonas sp. TaxID=1872635 RepID=UPI002D7E583A|nr:flagellar hook capping FlgD N-terminal domain-containing protein [Arenimonas sp.]HEU0153480.1 flagellar hook capping FlgD N-terminal domain-containing protein [Arenimonas sp.]